LIRAATAKKRSLPVGRYVDVEHPGHGAGRPPHAMHIHTMCGESLPQKPSEIVLADASDELHPDAPSPQGQSAIRSNAATMQLEPLR